jgi:endonuclease/exonuclease/phosphatase family metal-dependent hydrolase
VSPRRSLPTRLSGWLAGLAAELLLLFLPGCSHVPTGDGESFGVVENPSAARPALPATLRVLTWNVHGAAAARDGGHLHSVAAVIRESGADVVLLQEVHRRTGAGGGGDQFGELVTLTGMNGCFGKSLDLDDGAYGNAILSRAPLRSARTARLPGGGEPRTVLRCESEWDSVEIPLLTTHLAAWDIANRRQRRAQVSTIAARLAADANPLAILGGDFNAAQSAPEMLPLREHSPVQALARARLVTYRGIARSYDHLFAGSGWSPDGVAIVRDGPSDHWPVAATLRRASPAGAAGAAG